MIDLLRDRISFFFFFFLSKLVSISNKLFKFEQKIYRKERKRKEKEGTTILDKWYE